MTNKENKPLDTFEVASQRRRDVLLVILIITTVICVIMYFNRQGQINDLQSDIKDKQEKKTNVVKHNDEVKRKQQVIDEQNGLAKTQSQAKEFDDYFFNWDTWGDYTEGMHHLQKSFPNLKDSKVVDISGKKVGRGESPTSSYSDTGFTTRNKGELAQLITQTKKTPTAQTETLWLKISNYQNNQYDISKLKPYREIDMGDRGGSSASNEE